MSRSFVSMSDYPFLRPSTPQCTLSAIQFVLISLGRFFLEDSMEAVPSLFLGLLQSVPEPFLSCSQAFSVEA